MACMLVTVTDIGNVREGAAIGLSLPPDASMRWREAA
jgi:hypothetical protein